MKKNKDIKKIKNLRESAEDEIYDGELDELYEDVYDTELFDDDKDDDLAELDKIYDETLDANFLDDVTPQPKKQPQAKTANTSTSSSYIPANDNSQNVNLYNELNRLKDELSKTQQAQAFQSEISKLKDSFEQANKNSEEKFLNELRALRTEMLRYDSNVGIDVNKQRAMSGIYRADDSQISSLSSSVNDCLNMCIKSMNDSKLSTDTLKIEIENLKKSIALLPAKSELDAKLTKLSQIISGNQTTEIKVNSSDAQKAHKSEINMGLDAVRRLIELKLLSGRVGKDEYDKEMLVLGLYDTLLSAKNAVYSDSCNCEMKIDSLLKFENEVSLVSGVYLTDLILVYNSLIEELLSQPLTLDGIEAFSRSYFSERIQSTFVGSVAQKAVKYVSMIKEAMDREVGFIVLKLPEIIKFKNSLIGDPGAAETEAAYQEILAINNELPYKTEHSAIQACENKIREKFKKLCYLPYSEFVTWTKLTYDKTCDITSFKLSSQEYMDTLLKGDLKFGNDSVSALANAVNLLRSEIASGSVLGGGNGVSSNDIAELKNLQMELARKLNRTSTEFEKISVDIESIKNKLQNQPKGDHLGSSSAKMSQSATSKTNLSTDYLDEFEVDLDDDFDDVTADVTKKNSSTPDELNLFLSEIVSLRDEVQAYKDEVSEVLHEISGKTATESSNYEIENGEASNEANAVMLDELANMRAELSGYAASLDTIKNMIEDLSATPRSTVVSSNKSDEIEFEDDIDTQEDNGKTLTDILANLDDIKAILELSKQDAEEETTLSAFKAEVLGAIDELKNAQSVDETTLCEIKDNLAYIIKRLSANRHEISYQDSDESADISNDISNETIEDETIGSDTVIGETQAISELKNMIAELSEQIEQINKSALIEGLKEVDAVNSDNSQILNELNEIKELVKGEGAVQPSESKSEITAVKAGLNELKTAINDLKLAAPSLDNNSNASQPLDLSAYTTMLIKETRDDVKKMLDEPDYSVMNEILALREEFQNLRESVDNRRELSTNEQVIAEIKYLRDQIFAIEMSQIQDGEDSEYQSYNAIIFENIEGLKKDIEILKEERFEKIEAMTEEIASLKNTIEEQKKTQDSMFEMMQKLMQKIDEQSIQKNKNVGVAEKKPTNGKGTQKTNTDDIAAKNEDKTQKHSDIITEPVNETDSDEEIEDSIKKLKAELSQMADLINPKDKK